MTGHGGTAFREWLTGAVRGSAPIREQLLNRLRFADQLPVSVLRRFLGEAMRETQTELDDLAREGKTQNYPDAGTQPLHSMALEARFTADRRWLDAVGQLVEAAASQAQVTRVK
jgi:hypothetical protein